MRVNDRRHSGFVLIPMRKDQHPLEIMWAGLLDRLEEAEEGAQEIIDWNRGRYFSSESWLHHLTTHIVGVRPTLSPDYTLVTVAVEGEWIGAWGESHRFDIEQRET